MSFSSDTKNELCRAEDASCCRRAECYGLFLFGHSFSSAGVSLTTENQAAARRAAEFAAEATGTVMEVVPQKTRAGSDAAAYTVSAADAGQAAGMLQALGHSGHEVSLHINLANLENDCCFAAFLRGVFLACGTVISPESEYRLEFSVPFMNLANDLSALIRDSAVLGFMPGITRRKGGFVVYVKGARRVADLLTLLGAPEASMELVQVRMLKDLRNKLNRKTNFETANLEKTASAAAQEALAIEKIRRRGKLRELPDDLRKLASLRLRNPEMSLRDLGRRLTPPLSRSGVHHRLRRIVEYADKLG